MTVRRRTKLALGLGALAIGAAVLPGAVASGTNPPPVPITGGGVLRLHMDKDGDYFRFNPPTGTGGATLTQALTTSKCVASLKASPSLVTLTSTPGPPSGAVGLFDHRLGVKTGSEVFTCATVNGTEELALSLAGQLAAKQIDFGELDVAGTAGTTIRAQTALDGEPVTTTTLTLSGHGVVSRRWLIDVGVFDTLVLSVDLSTPKGAFWLQGGGHGTPALPGGLGQQLGTKDTVFQLTDFTGTIDCGETAPSVGGGESPEATFSRGQNEGCRPVPYLLRSEPDNAILLQKDASGQNGANFLLDITWEPEPKPSVGTPLRVTTIDYDGPGGDPPQPVLWCDGTPEAPQLPAEAGPEDTWCLASQSVALAGHRKIQISETYFGAGDPRWAR